MKVNAFTYFVKKIDNENWNEDECKVLKKFFGKLKRCQEEDLIIPRVVEVECCGLPVMAWIEENMRAYTKIIGEWVSWSYQDEKDMSIFNPRIICVTNRYEEVDEKLRVYVKGKLYEIQLKERNEGM